MSSGLKVESSNSPNLALEQKNAKVVKFDEPKKCQDNIKSKPGQNKTAVRPKGENRNPKKFNARQESFNKSNEAYHHKTGKRRFSYGSANDFKPGMKRRRQSGKEDKIILPTKFLLGGNINDPLNLGSLEDEEVNRRLNAVTPQSSPLPTPKHRLQVEILIPPNRNDPLNLNDENQDLELCLLSPNKAGKKKKKRNRPKSLSEDVPAKVSNIEQPANLEKSIVAKAEDVAKSNLSDVKVERQLVIKKKPDDKKLDKIVSPVVPQGLILKNRKRPSFIRSVSKDNKVAKKRHSSGTSTASTGNTSKPVQFRAKDAQFQYGNYNRYYGYRNQKLDADPRLKCLKKEWITGKDVLDIGCNVGHLTLTIAKDFNPKKIIGMDIDGSLIISANKNVRHYVTSQLTKPDCPEDFPISLSVCYGPIVAAAVPQSAQLENLHKPPFAFPYNVAFLQGDYVLESDEEVNSQKQEFDCILALSLTKWVHLNNGDAGLKRLFKRIFNQLRPGGKFVLEAQAWPSYDKKKKLTEKIYENYHSIQFKPEHFTEFLLSKQVGFITCEVIDTPHNPSKGFRRPIQLFTKAAVSPRDSPHE